MRPMIAAIILLLVTFSSPAQTVRYVHTDGLGSVVLTTDNNRNIVERSEYEPYGSLLNRAASDEPGYTGHVMDAATRLTYMQQRYYDPEIARFLSVDQVTAYGNASNFNRFTYARNNPYKYTDPDGRDVKCNGRDCHIHSQNMAEFWFSDYPNYTLITLRTAAFDTAIKYITAIIKLNNLLNKSESVADPSSASGENGSVGIPPLPTDLVGDQSSPLAGPNKSGKRHTSGKLTPENGGTGDYATDLEKLTGGTRPWRPGDKAPPGSQVGENGIFGRPVNSSGGKTIDIPQNGEKPHESLHYD